MAATQTITIRLERKRLAALKRAAKRVDVQPATYMRTELAALADLILASEKAQQEGGAA